MLSVGLDQKEAADDEKRVHMLLAYFRQLKSNFFIYWPGLVYCGLFHAVRQGRPGNPDPRRPSKPF